MIADENIPMPCRPDRTIHRPFFPNDACTVMAEIDAFLLRKESDKAFVAIDRLGKKVGGDPYLMQYRADRQKK